MNDVYITELSSTTSIIMPRGKKLCYPISQKDWEMLKQEIKEIRSKSCIFYSIGSLMIGGFLTLFASAFTVTDDWKKPFLIAGVAALIIGILCFCFGHGLDKGRENDKKQVLKIMDLMVDIDFVDGSDPGRTGIAIYTNEVKMKDADH